MKLRELGTLILLGIVAVCAVTGIISVLFLGPNNPVEEAAEDVIKEETGEKINLSPETPEIPKPTNIPE